MARRRFRVVLTLSIVTIAVAYLLLSGIRDSSLYYLTVDELTSGYKDSGQRSVRVVGKVSDIDESGELSALKFYLSYNDSSLYVIYKGPRPRSFGREMDVVVEGTLGRDGVFKAERLLTKCPSRYQGESGS